jgi:hypothetical protein
MTKQYNIHCIGTGGDFLSEERGMRLNFSPSKALYALNIHSSTNARNFIPASFRMTNY